MSKIEIRKVSITDVGTDAIVNAANEGLWAGTGVCGAIFQAAGHEQLQAACDKIGHCDTGSAVITPGFDLCKYIIHAVGPMWGSDHSKEKKQLYSAYQRSLKLALENSCRSIGFPLISAGVFGVPVDVAWRKALQACSEFEGDIQIVFAILDDRILAEGKKALAEIAPVCASTEHLNIDGRSVDAVYFHLPEETNGYLSNWYPARFTLDGLTFCCTEQYIMYRKCIILGDTDAANKIMQTEDPAMHQKIGQGAHGFNATLWSGIRQVVAMRGIYAKFAQNLTLKQKLLATGDAYLVECAHKDKTWACGRGLEEIERQDISLWSGKNILGFCLMEVRNQLKPDM